MLPFGPSMTSQQETLLVTTPGRLHQLRDRQFYKGSLANATDGSAKK